MLDNRASITLLRRVLARIDECARASVQTRSGYLTYLGNHGVTNKTEKAVIR